MSSGAETRWGTGVNAEAIEAWDGPLFDRWVRFRHVLTTGSAPTARRPWTSPPPQPGERVLDIGCGLGDTTQALAARVAPEGEAVGVDASARFIDAAREEAGEAGVEHARFRVADVQTDQLGEGFDLAYSRMGTMFFAARCPRCATSARP